jgi:hypothetical protein
MCGNCSGSPDLRAGDLLERLLDLLEAEVDDRFVAVEGEAHHPAPDLELASHPVDGRIGDRAFSVVPQLALRHHRGEQDRAQELRHVVDRPVEHQPAERVDCRAEIVVTPDT